MMARQLYTSDEHLNHKNIIRNCQRPWDTSRRGCELMTKHIIEQQNDLLRPGDTIYHVGDWAWGSKSNIRAYELLMQRLRDDVTHHLILGNHDKLNPFTYVELGFASVHTALQIKIGKYDAYLIHDPSAWTVLPRDSILVCGHIHGLFKALPDKHTVNVGVDVWDFKPVTQEEILGVLNLSQGE
jgi:calcineurin-like phosphoesterase family protein